MRIKSLKLSGYRQFLAPLTIEFEQGLTGICGPNGVGKSKIIEAIGYVLFGPKAHHVFPKGDVLADIPAKGGPGAIPRVELTLELRGKVYEIVRSTTEAYIRDEGSDEKSHVGATEVNKRVIELLRLQPGAYHGTFVARQNEVAGLQSESNGQDRKRLVNRLIGIEQVQKATELAEDRCRMHRESLKDYENALTITSAAAAQVLQEEIEEWKESRNAEAACQSTVDEAQEAYNKARYAKSELDKRVSQAEGFSQRVTDLSEHIATQEGQRRKAQARVTGALSAIEDLEQADRIIAETENARPDLTEYDLLFDMVTLQERRSVINQSLTDVITPKVARHNKLLDEIEQLEHEVTTLVKKEHTYSTSCALLEQRLTDIKGTIKKQKEHKRKLVESGDSGVCETCGRPFGDDYEGALRHFDEELALAGEQETDIAAQLDTAQIKLGAVKKEIDARRKLIAEYKIEVAELAAAVTEEAFSTRELLDIERELALIPATLQGSHYDKERHAHLTAELARREAALADKGRLAPIAALHEAAQREVENATEGIQKLQEQKLDIERQITLVTPTVEEVSLSVQQISAADLYLAQCRTAFHEAGQRVASAKGKVEIATERLENAKAQEAAIDSAKLDLTLSDSVKQSLTQLFVDITTTARPVLAQMIDNWARSFLGSRFHEIELSEDYKIRANNGSGMHNIEHFSGGEQTLLAIMLRVAIAMFCQQNARFDTGFLILDEVFGNQDNEHRRLLVRFLNYLQSDFSQIIIVNHVDDVTEELDKIIDVSATGPNTSTASPRGFM